MAKDDEFLEAIKLAGGGRVDAEHVLDNIKSARAAAIAKGMSPAEALINARDSVIAANRAAAEQLRTQNFMNLSKRIERRNGLINKVTELKQQGVSPVKSISVALDNLLTRSHRKIQGAYDKI